MAENTLSKFEEVLERQPPRRREILLKLLAGEKDEEIAESLGIHRGTVRKQISTLCSEFRAVEYANESLSRSDLIFLCVKHKPELLGIPTQTSPETDRDTHDPLLQLQNPFIPLSGAIDDDKLFFNRESDIQQIFDLLNAYSSVAIIGDRQIGKSSILRKIQRLAKQQLQQERQAIYLNLQPIKNEEDFEFYLCDELGINNLKGYQLTRELKKKKILLLIDEIEKITEDSFTLQIRDWLRGLAEGMNAPLRLVIAASQSLDSVFEDEGKTSPLANLCFPHDINPWDEQKARDFIVSRLSLTPNFIKFSEDEIFDLITQSQGHPQKLMQLCNKLYFDKKNEQ
ncbi:AAA family ATPase [Spirulina sp. CS-785/01]|uniref:AAA family ATPase n=1 Tax=Spirulina sp. CS-785/01 TaxID=3021716 RepID=UPI00232DDF32|nr:AAA family ATPase [Spirulina sp. CS-785/01]MDB9314086.1 AAA family ATPase [Spirulina sp. CS-785/01]